MIDFRYLIGDVILHHKSLQEIINRRFRSKTQYILDKEDYKTIETKDGIKFYTKGNLETLKDIKDDYVTNDIHSKDTVFDLGANIGGFTLLAAKVGKKVVSVEPVMWRELIDNIGLNLLDNVTLYIRAISNEKEVEIHWEGIHKVSAIPFKTLLAVEGPCDFLKCDIEGGEWSIDPVDLSGIRRIEMEMHKFGHPNHKSKYKALLEAINITHNYEITPRAGVYGILHARMK